MNAILTTLAKFDINRVLLHGEKQKKTSPEKPVEETKKITGAVNASLFYTNLPEEDENEI